MSYLSNDFLQFSGPELSPLAVVCGNKGCARRGMPPLPSCAMVAHQAVPRVWQGRAMADPLAQYADQLIYLCSAQASSQLVIVAQRKVETQIDALRLEHVKIDGMVEENKPARAEIWKKCEAKPGTYPIILNMKTGDFWHGDELQAPSRHARSPRPCHHGLQTSAPFCRTRLIARSSRGSLAPSSKREPKLGRGTCCLRKFKLVVPGVHAVLVCVGVLHMIREMFSFASP